MKFSISITNRKQTASFRIVGLMLAIALLWLAPASTSAQAQTSNDDANASTNTATASSPGDWTQFLRDNMQRWNPYETVLGVNNVGSLQLKWTQTNTLPSAGFGNPVVANGVAYFGGGEGDDHLYAFDARTGQPVWTYTLAGGHGVIATPAVANGVVYFATFVRVTVKVTAGTVITANAATMADTIDPHLPITLRRRA
jgi:outer membrane protein assembly factor BamB